MTENVLVRTAARAILNDTSTEASLRSDSPSNIAISPLGNLIPLVIDLTATASVGDKIAAKTKHAAHGIIGSNK